MPMIVLLLVSACQAAGETVPPGSRASGPSGASDVPEPTEASAPASGSPDDVSLPPSGEPLTEEHSGATVELTSSETVTVRLSSEWAWDVTEVIGDAVEPVPVNYAQDPGYFEWEIAPRGAGEAEVTFTGNGQCGDTTVCPPREAEFQFVVTD
jgi:hypothetical protein